MLLGAVALGSARPEKTRSPRGGLCPMIASMHEIAKSENDRANAVGFSSFSTLMPFSTMNTQRMAWPNELETQFTGVRLVA